MWQWGLVILALGLAMLLTGCSGVGFGDWRKATPKTQTRGGSVTVQNDAEGVFKVEVVQPSNPDKSALVSVELPTGERITAGTGSSRKDEHAGLSLKLDQYKTFSYVGAGVCVLGVGLLVASFWFPLIPKLAGPMVFAGGALTAYMSTAIPDYGPYFLVISLIGAVAWYYHHTSAKKDPQSFIRNPNTKKQ